MLVNGIFGVVIEVETLHNFPNESFDDFFLSALVLTAIYCQKTGSTPCLCVSVAVQVYCIYLHRRGNRATDLQCVVANRAYCFDLGRALTVATAF